MSKILSTLLAILLFSGVFAQTGSIRGITVTGIKGIKKSLADVLAQERSIPLNYKVHLRPELEGPRPIGQNPNAKPVSKSGTLVTPDNVNNKVTATSPPTQAVNSNFLTIWGSYASVAGSESPYTPPDNCGDVGTTQIIATANCRMKVFNKPAAGAALTTPTGSSTTTLSTVLNVDLNVFFTNSSLGINSISDPHVRFDRLSGRWFVVAIEVNHRTNNYCCIAVSDGPTVNAATNFSFYYFNVSQTGGSSTDFFDYPTLGVDKKYLYIGGNMFANQSSFSGCNMWVVNKDNLISASPSLTVTGFPHTTANKTDIYTPQGVHNDDPAATEGYFVGASQGFYSKLNIKRVIYGTTPTLSNDLALSTITTYTPKTVPTLNGTSIDGGDRRLYAAMIKKNKITGSANLWIAQGTRLNSSGVGGLGGDRDGALWLEIGSLTTTPAILQSAMLYDTVNTSSSTAVYYTYPTIALSGQGHNVMGFTSAGPAKYAQAAAAGRYRTDPAGNFQYAVDFTATGSSYNPGANRWGDYTQTGVDPTDDMTMWTFSEYACTTNAWGVRAAQFKAPPPATPVLSATPACGTTTHITINGSAPANTNAEFFDPGADVGGPGFNHLNVAVSGPSAIAVSNVVFVTPLQITADFTVPANAVSGTYTVTVTNPDGQTSSTQFNLNCTPATCGDPTGLGSSSITNTSATLSWSFAGTAISYDVQYKITSSAIWTTITVTNPTVTLTNLTPNTSYDWQVKANCSGASGNYVAGTQFTTTATTVTCTTPTNPASSAITSNSATVSWTGSADAVSYDVEYKLSSAAAWTTAAAATTSTSATIGSLSPTTSYDWHVKTNCSGGSSDYSATQSFTTTAIVNCPDAYEPNNSLSTAAAIPVNTPVNAQIASGSDLDYYSFGTSGNQKNIMVTLSSPVKSNLTLYNSNGSSSLGTTTGSGTTSVTIIYNTNKAGSYKLLVAGVSGAFNATDCYTLNVQTGNTTFTNTIGDELNNIGLVRGGLKVYPVPASTAVTVSFDAYAKGSADIIIINQVGQQVLNKKVLVNDGINFNTVDVSALRSGVYTVKVNNGKEIQTKKMIINK